MTTKTRARAGPRQAHDIVDCPLIQSVEWCAAADLAEAGMRHGHVDRLPVRCWNKVIGYVFESDLEEMKRHGDCLRCIFVRDAMRRLHEMSPP
jgi:predicted transcriptional regulator